MRLFLLLVFHCACLCLAASGQSASPAIPFQLLGSGHILVKATVDGVEGNFLFDTGAGLTVLTKTFFDKLPHAEKKDGGFTAFRATGERLDADLYTVKDFELGSMKHAAEEVSYLDVKLGGLDGIISLKFMEKQPFTIDLEKKEIRLETPATLAAIRKTGTLIPIQPEDYRGHALDMFAYFRVNDTLTLQLSLDSGAGKDVFKLNAKYLQALGVNVDDTTRVKKTARRSEINKDFVSHTYLTSLDKLAAAAAPSVYTTGFRAQFVEGLIYDGIMWINWLGNRITIDVPGRAMLVQN